MENGQNVRGAPPGLVRMRGECNFVTRLKNIVSYRRKVKERKFFNTRFKACPASRGDPLGKTLCRPKLFKHRTPVSNSFFMTSGFENMEYLAVYFPF